MYCAVVGRLDVAVAEVFEERPVAHRDDAGVDHRGRVHLGGTEVGEAGTVCLDQGDLGAGGHGVGPLDVQGDLEAPAVVADRR